MPHDLGSEAAGLFRKFVPLKGRFPREREIPETLEALRLYRGDTFRFTVQVVDEKGIPVDLTGFTSIISTWKEQDCFDEIVFEFDTTDQITVTDLLLGRFILEIPAATTALLDTIDYVFDIQITLSDGTVGTVIKRHVEVLIDVTI